MVHCGGSLVSRGVLGVYLVDVRRGRPLFLLQHTGKHAQLILHVRLHPGHCQRVFEPERKLAASSPFLESPLLPQDLWLAVCLASTLASAFAMLASSRTRAPVRRSVPREELTPLSGSLSVPLSVPLLEVVLPSGCSQLPCPPPSHCIVPVHNCLCTFPCPSPGACPFRVLGTPILSASRAGPGMS